VQPGVNRRSRDGQPETADNYWYWDGHPYVPDDPLPDILATMACDLERLDCSGEERIVVERAIYCLRTLYEQEEAKAARG
jgi:hypothetical protein